MHTTIEAKKETELYLPSTHPWIALDLVLRCILWLVVNRKGDRCQRLPEHLSHYQPRYHY